MRLVRLILALFLLLKTVANQTHPEASTQFACSECMAGQITRLAVSQCCTASKAGNSSAAF
jgi:hypothetical protein